MTELKINKEGENWYEFFNLTEERGEEISFQMHTIMHDLHRPTKGGVIDFTDVDLMIPYIGIAKTEEERVYCAFMAGRDATRLYDQNNM